MIKEITDQSTWTNFAVGCQPNTFLQSWEWGEVQQASGEEVKHLGIFKDDNLIAVALVVIVNAKRGRHYFIPHGPIAASDTIVQQSIPELVSYLKQSAQSDGVVALRLAPLLIANQQNQQLVQSLGFRPAPLHVHAELTWVLDISSSEEEILQGMRKTTRHAIRKSQQAGVSVETTTDPEALNRFLPLYEQTRQRHDFVPFNRAFLNSQVQAFAKNDRLLIAIARYEKQDVAAAILVRYGNTLFYHHGASIRTSVPAAQLLHWKVIQKAKQQGVTHYNFWGIAPERNEGAQRSLWRSWAALNRPHPFAGITVFKKGFGGQTYDYLHAHDLPLSPRYWQLWLVDSYRKYKRGF